MPKNLLDVPGLAGMRNRAPMALGPGVIRVNADAAEEAEIYIYGDIGGWWDGIAADTVAKEIDAITAPTIHVRLNSPGGGVFDGVAIYNALARKAATIIVHIDGIAASIASVIAMAGDEIRIAEGAHLMIHKPWSGAMGDAETLRKEADVLDTLESGIIDIYAARTGQDRQKLVDWVAAETWFGGQEAVDAGFADTLVPAKKKAAPAARSAMMPLFAHVPADLRAGPDDGPAIRQLERALRDGEGLSHSQARRVAALALSIQPPPRDAGQTQPPPLRDEGEKADLAAVQQAVATLKTLLKK